MEIHNNLCQKKRSKGRSASIYRFHDNNERKCVVFNLIDTNKMVSMICYVLPHTDGIY